MPLCLVVAVDERVVVAVTFLLLAAGAIATSSAALIDLFVLLEGAKLEVEEITKRVINALDADA